MKGYFEARGQAFQLVFDPETKSFVPRAVPHDFPQQSEQSKMPAVVSADEVTAETPQLMPAPRKKIAA
jgi:hypothetical protein